VHLEFIDVESDIVNPDVLKVQFADDIYTDCHVRLQLPLVVLNDGRHSRRRRRELLLNFPANLENGLLSSEAP